MKKLVVYSSALLLCLAASCTSLDVDVKSELTPDNFPNSEEQFVAASGVIYTNFALGYADNYWELSELSGDEAVLTANGGNWFDGGQYKDMHYHTWNKNNPLVENAWSWLYKTINSCNQVYSLLEGAADSEAKARSIAELRTMRAFCYYLLIDNFGDVPLVKSFGETVGSRNSRKEVFDYVEEELLDALPDLSSVNDVTTYGRPTQLSAYAMLAKLYMNAEVFVGEKRYDDAVSMCDKVIAFEKQGQTTLTPNSSYLSMFNYDNGPDFKEILFAIPYDENNLKSFKPSRYSLSIYHPEFWGFKFTVSSCTRILPSFYDLFTQSANDVREKQFLTGKQYLLDGSTPMVIQATKVQLDNRYTSDDKDEVVDFHIEFTKDIEFRDIANFDTGDDVKGRLVGYRCNKYPASSTQTGREQSNDFPVFRYADILLMKAEALLRGAKVTNGETALYLVNRIRQRAGVDLWTNVSLDELLQERAREFSMEAWRRNDLIRFGKFEDKWLVKTDNDPRKRLFPIPQKEIDKNPALEQNPGY